MGCPAILGLLAEQLKDLSLLGLDFSLEVHQELDAHCPRQGKLYGVVLHPFRRSFRNRMPFRFEMGYAILAMGTAAGGCALRRSRKLPVGRSRSTSPGGNGLRKLRRGRHRGNRDGWNGPFWREHKCWSYMFPGAYPPRTYRAEVLFGRN